MNLVEDREKAMTELDAAVADARDQPTRLLRIAAALYEADKSGVKQKELIRRTGYSREHVRRRIEDEKIRRGEMEPTPRYLREQARAAQRADVA
jgi:hypothetical protein